MNTEKDDLIYHFLQGELTATEEKELMAWLDSSDKHRQHLKKIQNIWNAMADDGALDYDATAAFERFHQQIATKTPAGNDRRLSNRKRIWRRMVQVAASVVLLVGVAWGGYYIGHHTEAQELREITMSTPNGSYAYCTLPDGTRLALQPGSQITYPQDFGKKERRVHLQGEAMFDIRHDDKMPFVVKTRHVEVKDMGTTFWCKDFVDEDCVEVQLTQGLVEVSSPTSGKVYSLKPSQQLSMNKKTQEVTISYFAEGEDHRYLSFDGDDLKHIAKVLERIYGVNIIFKGDILSRGYTFHGKFTPITQRVTDILDMLARTNLIHYNESGKNITVW